MRKATLFLSGIMLACLTATAQVNLSKKSPGLIPFAEASLNFAGCGIDNPVTYMFGVHKAIAKHWIISTDVLYWKTGYETFCCDVYSKGTYSHVIPSVKINFDPGRKFRGIFAGVGIGYVFAKDRGTEQSYNYDANTGTKTFGNDIKTGNWDYNGIAESFNWGFNFRIAKVPVTIVNTNYFAPTTQGWGPISCAVGLRVNFAKMPAETKEKKDKKKRCSRTYFGRCRSGVKLY